jgi:hypothetical protein
MQHQPASAKVLTRKETVPDNGSDEDGRPSFLAEASKPVRSPSKLALLQHTDSRQTLRWFHCEVSNASFCSGDGLAANFFQHARDASRLENHSKYSIPFKEKPDTADSVLKNGIETSGIVCVELPYRPLPPTRKAFRNPREHSAAISSPYARKQQMASNMKGSSEKKGGNKALE